ncbi:hypothetical protein PHMEG_00018676 [Phytophthora megakarya]|uniref:Uncharacterized protein n=1 Tax=Phytophthora megakarya TaxID=4795 RepID=A0A225VTH3_9STRA|nr:hypothetical protein PHMEG_00018676 [Phytophthora megakarya]
MFQLHSAPLDFNDSSEIERLRARHRLLSRRQQNSTPVATIEDLDVDEGRRRKVSAKWRQQQSDDHWVEATHSETHTSFNAFNFSSCPEAFDQPSTLTDKPLSCNNLQQNFSNVEDAVTSMGFNVREWVPGMQQRSPLGPNVPSQSQCN